jgi:dethiobiotin synthetase
MKRYFITGTGTDVGKTFVTCAIINQLVKQGKKVEGLKPIISGFTDDNMHEIDTAEIIEALGHHMTPEMIAHVSPWRFIHPMSPDMAAKREGRQIDYRDLLTFCQDGHTAEYLLIEGVGGAFVPLDASHLVADWITDLDIPALVVAGSYLGTLSHTLATIEALKARKIGIQAIVISESAESPVPIEETRETMALLIPDIPITVIPRLPHWRDAPNLTELIN